MAYILDSNNNPTYQNDTVIFNDKDPYEVYDVFEDERTIGVSRYDDQEYEILAEGTFTKVGV